MTRECDRDDVDELLAKIEAADEWRLEDWDFTVGQSESGEVTMTVRWDPPLPRETIAAVKEEIGRYEDDGGITEDDLRESLADYDGVAEAVGKLKQQGEIYRAGDGQLRRT